MCGGAAHIVGHAMCPCKTKHEGKQQVGGGSDRKAAAAVVGAESCGKVRFTARGPLGRRRRRRGTQARMRVLCCGPQIASCIFYNTQTRTVDGRARREGGEIGLGGGGLRSGGAKIRGCTSRFALPPSPSRNLSPGRQEILHSLSPLLSCHWIYWRPWRRQYGDS